MKTTSFGLPWANFIPQFLVNGAEHEKDKLVRVWLWPAKHYINVIQAKTLGRIVCRFKPHDIRPALPGVCVRCRRTIDRVAAELDFVNAMHMLAEWGETKYPGASFSASLGDEEILLENND